MMAHDSRLTGATHGTVAPAFRDRGVNGRAVVCPDCGAAVGDWCTGLNTPHKVHRVRRKMAVRALNAVADASPVEFRVADLRYAQAMPARKRRLLRVAAGLTTAELNALVGSAGRSVHFWEQGTTPTGEAGAKYGAWLREVASR